jgi:putative transcriptional regulator
VHLGWSTQLFYRRWSRMRRARLRAGLTQGDLAAIVGTSLETISSVERGESIPSVTLALAIASALDVSVEELFSADELR